MSEAEKKMKLPENKEIQDKLDSGVRFNMNINLYDTVEVNEDFYVGDQWKGVSANGLPTPTYNILKQVVNFLCATASSDNVAIQANPMPSTSSLTAEQLDVICQIVNHQFSAIIERNGFVAQVREMLRNAAVDGDGCIYSYFDSTIENGQDTKGEIVTEVVENTRVIFGNPCSRNVQKQPWIIVYHRDLLDDVRYRTEMWHKAGLNKIQDPTIITVDQEKFNNVYDNYTEDKVTVATYMFRNRETDTIWFAESTEKGMIRDPRDSGFHLYPVTWMSWDRIHDCYHGRAMITGLIPNQKFINKMFAMVGLSLISMSFPKIIYDKTKIDGGWDGSVGSAIGVNGPVDSIAKVMEGAPVNPQIAQFIEMSIEKTRSFLGASDVALGDSRPDNTSAIIALQRAANTPMEMTKQDLYQCIDDIGKIWVDMMAAKYGSRAVDPSCGTVDGTEVDPTQPYTFDFSALADVQMSIKREVGASSYWSEMATQQTLDNLLMQGLINPVQYLERLPGGNITKQAELIEELKAQMKAQEQAAMAQQAPAEAAAPESPEGAIIDQMITSEDIEPHGGPGNGSLQRKLNEEGVV